MDVERNINRKKMLGVVVKDKMEKTVVVEAEKSLKHPKYHKYIKTKKRYKAHDEANACKVGDTVLIIEAKPISKDKKWVVKEIVKKDALILVQEGVGADDPGGK